jgi:hypothetical protein
MLARGRGTGMSRRWLAPLGLALAICARVAMAQAPSELTDARVRSEKDGVGPAPAPLAQAPSPPAAARRPPPAWRLEGTVIRDGGSTAYIADAATNDVKGYHVGDAIGDGVVETIEERHVVLKTPRGPVELKMEEPRPARPPGR